MTLDRKIRIVESTLMALQPRHSGTSLLLSQVRKQQEELLLALKLEREALHQAALESADLNAEEILREVADRR